MPPFGFEIPLISSAAGPRSGWRTTTKCSPARYSAMTTRPLPDQDWTEGERAEIRRLEKVCDASEHWTLECSQTDHRRAIHGGLAARATICEDGHHGFGQRYGSRRTEITEATRVSWPNVRFGSRGRSNRPHALSRWRQTQLRNCPCPDGSRDASLPSLVRHARGVRNRRPVRGRRTRRLARLSRGVSLG